MSEISDDPKLPKRGQVLFAALFLICATLLLAAIGDQTKWLKGKDFFAQPRFWPGIGVGGMVLFTALHYWNLPRRERRLPRWMREADWLQWAESLAWAVIAGGLALWLGPVLAAPFVFLLATLRISYLYLHKMDWKEAKAWLSVLEWAGWFLAYVFLVPLIGYLPVTLVFAPLLTWRIGYRSRLLLWSSVVFGFVVVVVFKSFLQVKIPGAALYEYLPGALRNFFILNF
ncbi:tripartite tricarboxylate transporter TctB family protein [Aliiroseovarius subalbicans]|uniref:tripartite tricarboxylate transporter TctB family protein n=1 Tax=Aliiroseovarius subalbicans TaxID=2925840 RepID=UPI001F590E7E|nr:tripartite tricarboxylate transporter TctB family protein [Aliiroseovarius subalbicans]MCI2397836.1 tripartite tricarboxylate transporter TctB family protein [Aliiroseovarius subalbicans]